MAFSQFLHLGALDRCGPALIDHVLCRTRPDTALPPMPETAPVILADDPEGLRYARELRARQRRGFRPKEVLSVLIAGPAPYCHLDPYWTDRRSTEYLHDAYRWLVELLGLESRIIAAAIHRDEGSPHLHVVAAVIHESRLGWCRRRDHVLATGKGRTRYSRMQTRFHDDVAKKFKLERGMFGSKATQERPDPTIALAMREIRLRHIHLDREAVRRAGQAPHGLPELLQPKTWEEEIAREMEDSGEDARLREWLLLARVDVEKGMETLRNKRKLADKARVQRRQSARQKVMPLKRDAPRDVDLPGAESIEDFIGYYLSVHLEYLPPGRAGGETFVDDTSPHHKDPFYGYPEDFEDDEPPDPDENIGGPEPRHGPASRSERE